MRTPWAGSTGLAKAATILATVLLVSLGLCGVNFVAAMSITHDSQLLDAVLTFAGIAELVGMGGSLLGLVVVAGIAVVRKAKGSDGQ